MLRLHEGWDYTLYKIYLAAGIIGLMGGPILAALILGGSFPFADYGTAYMLGLTGWIAGILLYWWWVFLFKDKRALTWQASASTSDVPPLRALQSLSRLHQAMTVHGGDLEAWQEAQWSGKRPVLEFYGWMNLLVAWILGAAWAGMLAWFPAMDPIVLPAGVLILVVIMILRTNALVGKSAEGFAIAYLKPLGLDPGEIPTIKPRLLTVFSGGQFELSAGPAVFEGQRRGRAIRIEILDQTSRTVVQSQTIPFVLHSPDGKLRPEGEAPESVRTAVKALRKANRWKGIQVSGGAEGVAVQRESRRHNMWLYDLWLAEFLLEKVAGTQRSKEV